MKKVAVLLGMLCFLAVAPRVLASDGSWTKTWTISGAADLHLDADYGTVHIASGPANSIHADIETTYWHIAPDEVEVSESQDGNRVELRVRTPNDHGGGWFHWHSPKVEIDITVPDGSQLNLHTGFGDIRGDNLRAHAHVDTGFGGIHFPEFKGQLNGETGFGDITADGRFDSLELKTGFGSVHAEADSGSQIRDDWRLESGFGDVSLRVPLDMNANLDAESGFGHVSTDIPLSITENSGHSSIHGQLGKGGSPLELSTGFGSVHLGRS